MKKQYVNPTVRCIAIKSSSTLLQDSLPVSGYRHTNESFSRQMDNGRWDEEE